MTNISDATAANSCLDVIDWRELLRQSKETHDRNFGPHPYAEWIYSDLSELFDSFPSATAGNTK